MPPMKSRRAPGKAPHSRIVTPDDDRHSLTDSPVKMLERRLRVARWAHEQMPLTVVYGPRRLRPVGLERWLAEGRWVA
jgi:hypothetical protein